jgi:hypothetical protein
LAFEVGTKHQAGIGILFATVLNEANQPTHVEVEIR